MIDFPSMKRRLKMDSMNSQNNAEKPPFIIIEKVNQKLFTLTFDNGLRNLASNVVEQISPRHCHVVYLNSW